MMYCRVIPIVVSLAVVSMFTCCTASRDEASIDLSGEWTFGIDSLDKGIEQEWFNQPLPDKVKLPGSMLTNGKGNEVKADSAWTAGIWNDDWFKKPEYARYREPGNVKISFWLQPLKRYTGVAWYQKEIEIPENWNDRHIELFLERCHWETSLWIDDVKIGMQNALGAPHKYDLSKLVKPGKHKLTLRIDNRVKEIDPGADAHSISDNTQTNWNGVIGEMKLVSRPPVYISSVQLFPDIDRKIVTARISVRNLAGRPGNYQLKLQARSKNGPEKKVEALYKEVSVAADSTDLVVEYPMGVSPLLWDEFNPWYYAMEVSIKGDQETDSRTLDFGMRKVGIAGKQITINSRPVFLRGTLECAIFPETGYPPTREDEWQRIFKICKSYGLNHIRFHSWCPPEAAFTAADKAGIYLAVESSAWATVGDGKPIDQYVYDESNRIVSAFGNHPSFCLMAYGNEAHGDNAVPYLTGFVNYWKEKDKRRIYTSSSGFPASPASEYTSSGAARIQWWEGGLTSPINAKPPASNYEWTPYLEKDKPTVSHEIGQWCVYPDFREMSRYNGVLKPKNFEIFRDRLADNHLLHLADSFLLASGKLQVLCYKADIEAAFRTPEFAGFQLLDLHDFPGQGTALVGVLNAFWEEKGYVTAKEFRRFCNSTVPLASMPKMIFTNNERLNARLEVAHHGAKSLNVQNAGWKLQRADGSLLYNEKLKPVELQVGRITLLDSVSKPLTSITSPEKLTLSLTVDTFSNSWDVWVYPAKLPVVPDEQQIKVVQKIDEATVRHLESGGTVLLTLKKGTVKPEKGGSIAVGFSSIFWNTAWTKGQAPHTLGVLCDPRHPALAEFPTEYHSNYQWWDAMSHSDAIIIDSVDNRIKPIVRIIDDWFTARPLGLVFECKVGKGKLLVTGVDLLSEAGSRPEARQLLFSIKKYMAGDDFHPAVDVNVERIKSLLK
ncbi:sugar-binding domain-containing protein [Flavihumibacter solisilvae]|uniref:beta-galactosidase n=1 Tax=Flavihumibacter solisilvae TaxID=1349421 RepID=A0A0C1L2W6_9BACT|nr:sugar-binding domain-containing protein [Flavihumibacter solisilvae]KIC94337.1 beta-galactosidase [Flavihumibacter solisilvae]